MFQIIEYQSLSDQQHQQFFDFLKNTVSSGDPAAINMWAEDWQNCPNTLPYILTKTDRFRPGQFFLVLDNDKIVACSGTYISDFSNKFVLAGTRMWIDPLYRNRALARNLILPYSKKFAYQHDYSAIGVCFNDYNKNLIKTWFRVRLGESRSPRSQWHFGYHNLEAVTLPLNIKNTRQYLLYEKLNENFSFDWNTIQWRDQ